jgi:hypothetical protein
LGNDQTHRGKKRDIAVRNAPVDIVAQGYDAGIQLGEVIDRDMIAVPASGDLRLYDMEAARLPS